MFNWLGNLFPYSDLHSLNLDWILNKMKETAAQAAKAVADAANALAQVAEAKAAALSAQTAAQNAQTAANNAQTAADNAADSAENAVAVAQAAKSAAQTAQNTANTAQSAAQTAQNTANTAQSAAQTAQNTANTAKSAAQTAQNTANTAQSAAQTAQTAAENALSKFPVIREDIAESAVGSKQIGKAAVGVDKLDFGAVVTDKIADGAVTNRKMSSADFYVGIGSFSVSSKATSTQIAAGQADFNFNRFDTSAVIFVAYAGNDYNDGSTPHHLFMYSDPFIINTLATKRAVDITLEDFNTLTGEHTEYKGTLTISVSTSTPPRVIGTISFTETLPFSDDIKIPYGISGLSARPKL